jgi:hypothetical protein
MNKLILFAGIVGVVSVLLVGIATPQSVDAQEECSNCAWEFSPGHDENRREGESARDFAPGQQVAIGDPDIKDFAPGQEKRQAPPDPE